MGRGGIPDRWLEYTKTGKPMKSTKFVSFKVPLKPALTQGVTEEEVFGPSDLISLYKEKGIKLGLIIDLTFTPRYYQPEDFKLSGIQHVKIPIEGHMVPKKARMETFAKTVKNFLEKCKDKDVIIGVHCTHGVNRTGYTICKYLIDHEGMPAEKAIELFESSRGHKIERDVYINHLKTGELPESEAETYYDASYSNFKPGNKRPGNYNDNGSAAKYSRNDNWEHDSRNDNRREDSHNNNWRGDSRSDNWRGDSRSNHWERNSHTNSYENYDRGHNSYGGHSRQDNQYENPSVHSRLGNRHESHSSYNQHDNYSGGDSHTGSQAYTNRSGGGPSRPHRDYHFDARYDCELDRYSDHRNLSDYNSTYEPYHRRSQHTYNQDNRDPHYRDPHYRDDESSSSYRNGDRDGEKRRRKRKHDSPPDNP